MEARNPVDVGRRSTLLKTGAALATVGGVAVVGFGSSGTANAQVEASDLDIPKATREGEDGTVSDIDVSLSGSYQYTVNDADSYLITLAVASEPDKSDWGIIDQEEDSAMAASTAGQYSLSGSILSHDQIEAADFSADASETTTKDVPIMVALDVIHGGETIVSAIAETVAKVEVTSTAVKATAEVTGSGQVEIAV